jgi:hypothetical protein
MLAKLICKPNVQYLGLFKCPLQISAALAVIARYLWNLACRYFSAAVNQVGWTYYAGKSSTLKAAATTAHCANEG